MGTSVGIGRPEADGDARLREPAGRTNGDGQGREPEAQQRDAVTLDRDDVSDGIGLAAHAPKIGLLSPRVKGY